MRGDLQIYISVIKSLRRQRRATISILASKCVIIEFINIIMNVPSAMLPRVPNLFSRFRRRGVHSPTLRKSSEGSEIGAGGDATASLLAAFFTWLDRPTGPAAVACLIHPMPRWQSVSRSLQQPPPSPLLVKILQGIQPVFHAMLVLFLSLISILG